MKNMVLESGKMYRASDNITLSFSCGGKHFWTWAGDPNHPLPEGYPCTCGLMLWHTEICSECGNTIVKPKVRTKKEEV